MQLLSDFFSKKKSLKHLQRDALHTKQLQDNWLDVAGQVLGKQLKVAFVRGKIVELHCENPCWVQEIDYYKETLLKNIHKTVTKPCYIEWVKVKVV